MFIPQDYKEPTTGGGYLKMKDYNEVTLRILSEQPLMGYEYWNKDGKPVRLAEKPTSTPEDIGLDKSGNVNKIKHFWSMVVYNYKTESIEIFNITQASIRQPILALAQSEDWGNPNDYDIVVTKKGEGLNTEYAVMPKPKKPVSAEVLEALKETPVNLDALMTGDNPFDAPVAPKEGDDIAF